MNYGVNWNIEKEEVFEEDDELIENIDEHIVPSPAKPTQNGGNLIWTFVSSVLRFTKLSSASTDNVGSKATPTQHHENDAGDSMTVARRSPSFKGMLYSTVYQ